MANVLNPGALAIVSGPSTPEAASAVEARLGEEARTYEAEIAAAKAGLFSVDPHGDITLRTKKSRRDPSNDDSVITDPAAKIAIYRALGLPMTSSVDPALAERARALSAILAVVAAGEAPTEFVELADRLVRAWLDGGT